MSITLSVKALKPGNGGFSLGPVIVVGVLCAVSGIATVYAEAVDLYSIAETAFKGGDPYTPVLYDFGSDEYRQLSLICDDNDPCTSDVFDIETETCVYTPLYPEAGCPEHFSVCMSEPAFMLSGALPEGGVYSGPGVSEGMFDPASADIGTHTITYVFEGPADAEENVCSLSCTFLISVMDCTWLEGESEFASIDLIKTAEVDSYGAIGDVIPYVISVQNTSSMPVKNIIVQDPLVGLNKTIGILSPGALKAFTSVYLVSQADLDAGSVSNIATAVGLDPYGVLVSDQDSITVASNAQGGLTIDKNALLINGAPARPYAAQDEDGTILEDEFIYSLDDRRCAGLSCSAFVLPTDPIRTVTYELIVTNTGVATLLEVTLKDALADFEHVIPSIAPGASQRFLVTYTPTAINAENSEETSDPDELGVTPLVNTAVATFNQGGQAWQVSDTVTITPQAQTQPSCGNFNLSDLLLYAVAFIVGLLFAPTTGIR